MAAWRPGEVALHTASPDQKNRACTPAMVIDRGDEFVAADLPPPRRAIHARSDAPHRVIRLSVESQPRDKDRFEVDVDVGNLPAPAGADPIDLVLVVAEDGLHTGAQRGESRWRSPTHAVVVREMVTVALAPTAGSAHATIRIAAHWRREQLKIVAFLQQRYGRHVLATAVAPLETPVML